MIGGIGQIYLTLFQMASIFNFDEESLCAVSILGQIITNIILSGQGGLLAGPISGVNQKQCYAFCAHIIYAPIGIDI